MKKIRVAKTSTLNLFKTLPYLNHTIISQRRVIRQECCKGLLRLRVWSQSNNLVVYAEFINYLYILCLCVRMHVYLGLHEYYSANF